MTLICIWSWGSSSGDLGSVEYSIILITPRPTVNWSCRTCLSNIYGVKSICLKIIRIRWDHEQKQKLLKNNYTNIYM